jgi:hypothetical protein
VKDRWAALEAQAAVVGVTKRSGTIAFGLILSINLLAGCGVENVPTTIGAFKCNPTQAQIDDFNDNVIPNALVAQDCMTCHGTSATSRTSRLRIKNTGTLTNDDKRNNFCVAYSFGQASPSRSLITHPNDTKHVGYASAGSPANLTQLTSWVENTFLAP